jgi:hypothetical protein
MRSVLLLLLLLGGCTEPQSQTLEIFPNICMDAQTREKIRSLSSDAVDAAFKEHVEQLFINWLKDNRGQPGRAQAGMRRAITFYLHAQTDKQQWSPPSC